MNINELCPEFIVYGFLSDSNNKKARAQQHNEYVYTDDGIRLKTRHITVVTQSDKDMSSDSTEYIGNFTYEKGKMKMYNFGSGYIEPSTTGTSYQYRYYMKDHLGNNRVVSNLSGSIMQTNHYYPYGATLACSTNQSRQQYKYNGNLAQRSHRLSACSPSGDKLKNEGDNNLELDRTHGLNWYDYIARQYDPATGQFTSMDDFCEKYYHISPYVYCGGNPISRVDPDGDSIAVLNLGGMIGHSALLIQDDNQQWAYYSMNGTSLYDMTNGIVGGKPVHDVGAKTFSSPEDFLNSSYNQEAKSEEDICDNKVNNYGYTEAYVIPTSKCQDQEAVKHFSKQTEMGYDLFLNNCAQVVAKTLDYIGIKTYTMNYDENGYYKDYPVLPLTLWNNVILNNPNNKHIKR